MNGQFIFDKNKHVNFSSKIIIFSLNRHITESSARKKYAVMLHQRKPAHNLLQNKIMKLKVSLAIRLCLHVV